MEGLIICGLGDIARRQGNLPEAQHWYACAVPPAVKADNPVLMSNIVQNLAAIAYEQGRFSDAEKRYTELVTLKRSMLDEHGLVEALEWLGLSEEKQQAYDDAVVNWEEAALICKSFDLDDRAEQILAHLRRGYQILRRHEELASFDAEWRA
jgi:tetratricopeptide (TPR) repeat protein